MPGRRRRDRRELPAARGAGRGRARRAGVYYGAATTEAQLYRDAEVAVIGAGNSAGQATVHLAAVREAVHLVIRGDDLGAGMSAYLVEQIGELENVEVHTNTEAARLRAPTTSRARTFTTPDGEMTVDLDAMFIFIGQQPRRRGSRASSPATSRASS